MKKQIALSFLFVWIATIGLLAQITSIVQPESVGMSSSRLDQYSKFIKQQIDAGELAGAVSMIKRKGQLVQLQSYGYKNLETKAPMQSDQIFYIQSMTKPIISVALMMLYEEGHFFLHDPVHKYIPKFKDLQVATDVSKGLESETVPLERPITIAHLFSHTAGFSHGLGGSQLDKDYAKALYQTEHATIEERVNAMLELPLYGQPGGQWYYSAAPDVLALLVEQFSGKSVSEFLQERIFGPLGMEDTGYNLPKAKQDRMTTLHYINQEGKLLTATQNYQTKMEGNTIFGGTHGLFSTASDYMKFCQMLINGGKAGDQQLLSPKTIEIMTKDHTNGVYEALGQGFGLGFAVITDLGAYGETGSVGQFYWNGAYRTHFFIDPEEELVAIFMTQISSYSNYWAQKMRQMVYQAILD